ncbi:MAG: nucleotidyltransferase family protein [Caldilineaceae bacterium]
MKGLILAAGKGTRLRDLTLNRPKPMLPVQGKPLLAQHVEWLHANGIDQIAMNLHHCPAVITDYFGDGSRFGVQITYSYEPQLLGTAGAAKHLQAFFDEPFVVVYGDVFTNLALSRLHAFHEERKAQSGLSTLATLALYKVPNPTECGLVEIDETGRIQRFVEKPPPDQVFTDLANAGLMICEPAILQLIPAETEVDFGRHVFPAAVAGGYALWGQPIAADEYVIDIGTFHGYDRAQQVAQTGPMTPLLAQHF